MRNALCGGISSGTTVHVPRRLIRRWARLETRRRGYCPEESLDSERTPAGTSPEGRGSSR